MIPNSILGARKIGQMIWGSSAVQSLTSLLCPEVYENFSACWFQSLEACAIFHSAQLQFLQGFPFPSTHPLPLQSLATSTLLWTAYQDSHYVEVQIINFVDAHSQKYAPE